MSNIRLMAEFSKKKVFKENKTLKKHRQTNIYI